MEGDRPLDGRGPCRLPALPLIEEGGVSRMDETFMSGVGRNGTEAKPVFSTREGPIFRLVILSWPFGDSVTMPSYPQDPRQVTPSSSQAGRDPCYYLISARSRSQW